MRKFLKWSVWVFLLVLGCRAVNPVMIRLENDKTSVSTGESWNGKLENGKRMPGHGENFSGVSDMLLAMGRNGVHSELRKLVLAVYDTLNTLHPEWNYLYGETGWVKGGRFWPHYTHQNGLVIDFMVPVIDCRDSGQELLGTSIFRRFGYAYEFDSTARSGNLCINFESLGAHLYFLQTLGPAYGIRIKRIIFAPEFLPQLYATKYGESLKGILFTYNKGWLRHDDHYHTEFSYSPPSGN